MRYWCVPAQINELLMAVCAFVFVCVRAKVKKTHPRFNPQSTDACKRDLMLLKVHVRVREMALIILIHRMVFGGYHGQPIGPSVTSLRTLVCHLQINIQESITSLKWETTLRSNNNLFLPDSALISVYMCCLHRHISSEYLQKRELVPSAQLSDYANITHKGPLVLPVSYLETFLTPQFPGRTN